MEMVAALLNHFLEGPQVDFFGSLDQSRQETLSDPYASGLGAHVDADFRDARIDAASGNGAQGCPTQYRSPNSSTKSRLGQMRVVPVLP